MELPSANANSALASEVGALDPVERLILMTLATDNLELYTKVSASPKNYRRP